MGRPPGRGDGVGWGGHASAARAEAQAPSAADSRLWVRAVWCASFFFLAWRTPKLARDECVLVQGEVATVVGRA